MHKALEAAIKAISYIQPDVDQIYKLQRKLSNFGKLTFYRTACTITEMEIACANHSIPVRIYQSKWETKAKQLIIFFHGGGWVTGDLDSYQRVCSATALKTGATVASVEYRLAPEHKFPAGFEDCYAVTKYFYLQVKAIFGIDATDITLMGDSAGGNLAAAISLRARDDKAFDVKRQILIYPATYYDHSETSPFESVHTNGKDYILTTDRVQAYMDLYKTSDEDLQNPYFAPLAAKDFSRQPKTLIITAEYDPLRDEGEFYGLKLREAGTHVRLYRMMGALHGFFSLHPQTPAVKRSYKIINEFMEET